MASSNQSLARSPTEANSGQMASSTQSLAHSSQELFIGKMASQIQGSARIPTNVSDGQMASHIQGLARSPDTANPIVDSAWSPQNMGPTGPGGMTNPIQTPNQGNTAWYQPLIGNMWPGGQQNQNLPPFPPYYNPWYPYHMMMLPGAGGSQPGTSQMSNTVSTMPNQDSNMETKEMFVSAFCSMFADKINGSSSSINLSLSGKSAKMLSGINKHSVKGFCGKTFNEDVPEIFQIFDGNEHIMTKVQALEDHLIEAQCMNAMVKFTLRKELVKEFIQHAFHSDPIENNMLHGFTPWIRNLLTNSRIWKQDRKWCRTQWQAISPRKKPS